VRFSNARDESRDDTQYYPMTYKHPDGQETKYDLQQIRYNDGRLPAYVVSESQDNTGPGFDNTRAMYGVSEQAASASMALNKPEAFPEAEREIRPHEIKLFQQRTDGQFDRVGYRET
jgi:hypothetical protein